MAKLQATVSISYGGRVVKAGETFVADNEENARLLVDRGLAAYSQSSKQSKQAKPERTQNVETESSETSLSDAPPKKRGRPPKKRSTKSAENDESNNDS